jgi:hypothetical protein
VFFELLNKGLRNLQSQFHDTYLFELPLPPMADPLGGLNQLVRAGKLARPDLTVAKRLAVTCCDTCTSLCKPVYDLTRSSRYGGYYGSPYGYSGGWPNRSIPTPSVGWTPAASQTTQLPQALVDSLDESQLMLLASGGSSTPAMTALEQLAAAS